MPELKDAYDVVVVGAGPAGSVAARRSAEAGLRVLLIEKRQEIGVPVRCAEAIGAEITRPYIDINDKWVNARIDSYAVYNPEGDFVILPPTEPTLIVDRKVFDWDLANLAARAGAQVRTRTQAEGLLTDDSGRTVGVRLRSMGKTYNVSAQIVIAADGTESQVARWAGLKTVPPMSDFYVGFQYLLVGLGGRITPTLCEYHLGHAQAPSGYLWVFPKGDDAANVGIVIGADVADGVTAQGYLDRFVAKHFPKANILGTVAGGIPTTGALKRMVADGVMAVGDAAHQADPLTAGGINLGMIGAEMAAQVAVKAIHEGDVSVVALREYEHLWHERFHVQHTALYQLRKMICRMEDDKLSALVRTVSILPLEQMSLGQVLIAVFRHHPLMLIQAQALIATGLILK
ncbi:MAG TPA: NAD(P)/FAD-dependent oxidoreductase [Aggregatilineales bacterium]|nr:NAD(P)/FAD-dependent oxidoreductase [Anaerolineales bacterium]HRE46727.1 NAD(P)/FAD-dependent oxidoreductase [Aggregatilineales bacterium]